MSKFIFGLSVLLLIVSCNNNQKVQEKGNDTDVFTKVYTTDNIESQTFTIDNSLGGVITGSSGTKIKISKNSFVDSLGKLVMGDITLELKEALTPLDMVMGNLTTVYNGKPLETGGMICINGKLDSTKLKLADGKTLLVAVPTDSTLSDMSIFKGDLDSSGVEWNDPVPIENQRADTLAWDLSAFEKTTNVKYQVEGFVNAKNSPQEVQSEVGRIAWQGNGLKISKDSTFQIGGYTVHFIKQDQLLKWSDVFVAEKGTNRYLEDNRTNYIFTLKNLGWANIDRLYNDPRTQEVELITDIENSADFKLVYVTMITQNMYLPGYQKQDDTFSFSHGDYEKQKLPVGATATILATAYKKDKPFFAIQTITLKERQTVTYKLEETTMEQLKTDLKEKI